MMREETSEERRMSASFLRKANQPRRGLSAEAISLARQPGVSSEKAAQSNPGQPPSNATVTLKLHSSPRKPSPTLGWRLAQRKQKAKSIALDDVDVHRWKRMAQP